MCLLRLGVVVVVLFCVLFLYVDVCVYLAFIAEVNHCKDALGDASLNSQVQYMNIWRLGSYKKIQKIEIILYLR